MVLCYTIPLMLIVHTHTHCFYRCGLLGPPYSPCWPTRSGLLALLWPRSIQPSIMPCSMPSFRTVEGTCTYCHNHTCTVWRPLPILYTSCFQQPLLHSWQWKFYFSLSGWDLHQPRLLLHSSCHHHRCALTVGQTDADPHVAIWHLVCHYWPHI